MAPASDRMPRVDWVLWDLGGVIIELSGIPVWQSWTGMSEEESWERWLNSPAVRAFESGRTGANEFARALVQEFELPLDAEAFLATFERWPRGVYDGAHELLRELRGRLPIACLSNCNELHWPRFLHEMGLGEAFDACFSSHELGCLKPDTEVFDLVTRELQSRPERTLFLDDNPINVEGARTAGLFAHHVRGVDEARSLLSELGLL